MHGEKGWKLLERPYELFRSLAPVGDIGEVSERWLAWGEYNTQYLIKLWPFSAFGESEIQRALWDRELRTMYRLSSSPGAEASLLTIRDIGIDQSRRCFVMVMQAHSDDPTGYDLLEDLIVKDRSAHAWLSSANKSLPCDKLGGTIQIATSLLQMLAGLQGVKGGLSKCFVAGTDVLMASDALAENTVAWWEDWRIDAAGGLLAAGAVGFIVVCRKKQKSSEAAPNAIPDEDPEFEPLWVPLIPTSWMTEKLVRARAFRHRLRLGIRSNFELEPLGARVI